MKTVEKSLFTSYFEFQRNLLGKMYLLHSKIYIKTLNFLDLKNFLQFLKY